MKSKLSYKASAYGGLVCCLALGVGGPACGQNYQITDLGAPNDNYRMAHGINSAGEVVGEYATNGAITVGAFWYHSGTNTDIGVLTGYLDAYAYGINDNDQIAGYCDQMAGVERAFLYSNGTMHDLGTLANSPPGRGYSEAYAVNRSGQAVGTANVTDLNIYLYHAFLYSGGTMTDLGTLEGPAYTSVAYGLNNTGVIVGMSDVATSSTGHAFTYSNGVMSDLGTLPGGAYSLANAVNDSGVIVGEAETTVGAGAYVHAFVCTNGPGTMQDLGTFGGLRSSAFAINNLGQVVGDAEDTNAVPHAFLYDLNNGSGMVDLNTLIPPGSGWTNLEAAVGINDSGQIAGYGTFADGSYHSFLLTKVAPIPVLISSVSFSAGSSGFASSPGSFSFSFDTQAGVTYTGQFTTPLSPSNNWLTFTSLIGNGSAVRITDSTPTNTGRFYRVVAQ